MWIEITDRLPSTKGNYKIKVQWCDVPDEVREDEDYFNGLDFEGYRQFVNAWWDEELKK